MRNREHKKLIQYWTRLHCVYCLCWIELTNFHIFCSTAEFKISPVDKTAVLCFEGEESLFLFTENVLKLSYSNTEFKKIPGDNILESHFTGEESLFPFSENVPKFSYSNAEFKNSPMNNAPDLRLRVRKICFRSLKMY